MIYEVRTYDLKPGAIPQAEEAFAEALPHREKYGPIAAFWHTEIGPLNQIIHGATKTWKSVTASAQQPERTQIGRPRSHRATS